VCEIAVATNTAPRDWWDEDDETLATVIDILDEIRRETNRHGG
jgi:hypothetical protein